MTSTIYIKSGGTTYHLTNGGVAQQFYDGMGTPWTVQSTTPYQINMHDLKWTPQNPPRQEIYSGSPPLRNGRSLLYASYDNVVETIGMQMYATTHDNAVALLTQLRKILNTALFNYPAVLSVQPDGATNAVGYEIYGADVQESPAFINDEAGGFQTPQNKGIVRATVTLRRSPMGASQNLVSLLSNQSFTNVGSATNVVSLGALTGDLIYEGSPLNIRIVRSSGTALVNIALATVYSRTYGTITTATTTSSTTATSAGATSTFSIDALRLNTALKLRPIVQLSSASASFAKCQMQVQIRGEAGTTLWTSPWRNIGASTASWIDFGGTSLDMFRIPDVNDSKIQFVYFIRSTDGTSVTTTLRSYEALLYYDYCIVEMPLSTTSYELRIVGAQNLNGNTAGNGYVYAPMNPPRAYLFFGGGTGFNAPATVYGTLPRAWSGASLYMEGLSAATAGYPWSGAWDSASVSAVYVDHAPQYKTLRGAG